MDRIHVLIVDENEAARELLVAMLKDEEDVRVLEPIDNLHDAREALRRGKPDVLILSAAMPYIGGQSFIEVVLAESPLPVIMTARAVPKSIEGTLRALELGACESVVLPESRDDATAIMALQKELRTKLRAVSLLQVAAMSAGDERAPRILHFKAKREGLPVIAIGASTGGAMALRQLLAPLPTITPPMVIAHHLPPALRRAFALHLNRGSEITVVEAVHGAPLQNGYAFLAPAGKHLTVANVGGQLVCQLVDAKNESELSPSVDALFKSVAAHVGADAIGVVLTGMGTDGAKGLATMRDQSGYTIVQDEESSMLGDMPRAALARKAASIVLPIEEIAKHILDRSKKAKKRA